MSLIFFFSAIPGKKPMFNNGKDHNLKREGGKRGYFEPTSASFWKLGIHGLGLNIIKYIKTKTHLNEKGHYNTFD